MPLLFGKENKQRVAPSKFKSDIFRNQFALVFPWHESPGEQDVLKAEWHLWMGFYVINNWCCINKNSIDLDKLIGQDHARSSLKRSTYS